VDLDVAAVLFDVRGQLIDAAFYKQLEIEEGAIIHSGDNRNGEGDGDDETIFVNLDQLSQKVKIIMFVVSAYSGGTFKNVETANVELRLIDTAG